MTQEVLGASSSREAVTRPAASTPPLDNVPPDRDPPKTAGLAALLEGLNLSDKLVTADAWCVEMGADDVAKLAQEEIAEEREQFIAHLELPPMKTKKLRMALTRA